MPAELSRDDVLKIAALANLRLEADEIDRFARQLADILAYADEVRQVDTTGVAPTASVMARPAADRADEVQPSLTIADTLANAPDPDDSREEGGFFKVPRVIG
ncbi:MAG TPA: Asp-tRNA(Asn)/Glu-tRNA(Gln) amidotransferase subunit GatC [Vicinamibacterales bacterium]|nr:Asp-tRNA(Asn)/Glu-tRNA(Gln) amidotransferase subunit GatC [Vicinamibacterales bacterium]